MEFICKVAVDFNQVSNQFFLFYSFLCSLPHNAKANLEGAEKYQKKVTLQEIMGKEQGQFALPGLLWKRAWGESVQEPCTCVSAADVLKHELTRRAPFSDHRVPAVPPRQGTGSVRSACAL